MADMVMSGGALGEFVQGTLLDSFLKIARVNLITGEYEFLKLEKVLQDVELSNLPSIYDYIKKQVEAKLVLSEYVEDYLKFSDPAYVQARVFSGEQRIVQSYIRKAGGRNMWVTFGIVAPKDCGPDHPWALFTWREADTDTTTMVDALSTLSFIYYKILKINLTRDSYECVKVDDYELKTFVGRCRKISEWWNSFAEHGNVYPEDEEVYRQFTNLEQLRAYFKEDRAKISCRYRRKIGDEFRWVQMDLVPSIEYTNQNQVLILYVKDVHEEHLMELRAREELVDSYHRDALTMLHNRHKYNLDLERLQKGESPILTCMYIDVNGLHEMNNRLGHDKGDGMLCAVADTLRKYFPEEMLYRIGGDEFVMLSTRLSKRSVERILTEVRQDLAQNNYDISAGVESGARELPVYKIVGAAELAMRTDKELYYKKKGHQRRNRTLNEELERMLAQKRDAEAFLKIISTKFAGVYFVDLAKDTLRHIYIPDYFRHLLEQVDYCYSAALRLYVDRFVKEEYQAPFLRVIDYTSLAQQLKGSAPVQFSYQKVDGTWMDLRILGIDTQAKDETIWIFADRDERTPDDPFPAEEPPAENEA